MAPGTVFLMAMGIQPLPVPISNTLGNLMGGQLLSWMDINAAISAHRHCKRVVVTAAVNNVSFDQPIKLGDIVSIESKVSRAFSSSMEVYLDVFVEDHTSGKLKKCNEAIYTFVAVDQLGSAIHVPELIPETELEIKPLFPPHESSLASPLRG